MSEESKPAVDREAVRVLAIELGAREAARRLGIKESTVLSWARRNKWKLPKRKGGATLKSANAITMHSKPGDALIATHAQLEGQTKTGLMQALAKAAQQVAGKDALDVSNTAQLRDICLAAARIYGWKDEPQTKVNITNQVGVVVTEEQRQRLIALLEEQQRARAEPVVSAAAPDESQVQVKQPEPQWPSIGVDATYLPEPQPADDQDPDGLAEGWGLDHPELS